MKTLFTKETPAFKLTAKLAPDRMKLFVDAEPQGTGHQISRQDLVTVLLELLAKIDQVDLGVLDDLAHKLSKGEKALERRIIKGQPAENGSDGKLLLLVKKYTANGDVGEVKVDKHGFANFNERHLFDNILPGQAVGRIYPPKAGVDGLDAMGKAVPSKPGKPIKISLGKGLKQQPAADGADTYDAIIAEQEGYLTEDGGRLEINDELHVKGDLDFAFGNIDFNGRVKVTGDVLPGFSITAKTGIEIGGSMRGKLLVCKEGDITIKGHTFGGNGAKIVCSGTLSMKVAQEVHADVIGDIKIQKEAVDCVLCSTRGLYMPEGALIGGRAEVVCGVEAGYVGSESGKATIIRLSSDIEVSPEYAKLTVDIESHEKALTLLKLHLGPYAAVPMRIEILKEPHRAKMQQLYAKMRQIEESKIRLAAKRKKLLETAQVSSQARVSVQKMLYSGSMISAGEVSYQVKDSAEGPLSVNFLEEGSRFESGPFQNVECQLSPVKPAPGPPATGGPAQSKGERHG